MLRRMLSIMMCLALMLTMAVALPREAEAAAVKQFTLSEIEAKMDTYINWLNNTSYKYWNGGKSEAELKTALNSGRFQDGMTTSRCLGNARNGTHSCKAKVNGSKAGCTSNAFGGDGKQCRGFARYFWYYLYGAVTTNTTKSTAKWTSYSKIPSGGLQAGDYVDFTYYTSDGDKVGHSLIVRKVVNGKIYAVHCNGHSSKYPCRVDYETVYGADGSTLTEKNLKNYSFRVLRYNGITKCDHAYNKTTGKCTKCGEQYPMDLTTINKTYIATKSGVVVRSAPYESASTIRTLTKGENVFVKAQGLNINGERWCNLKTGGWARHSELKHQPVTFGTITFKRNSSTTVTPRCTITYDKGQKPTEVGVRIGLSKLMMVKSGSDKITHNKNPFDVWYTKLKVVPKFTYYYQFYAVIGGKTYYGNAQTYKNK